MTRIPPLYPRAAPTLPAAQPGLCTIQTRSLIGLFFPTPYRDILADVGFDCRNFLPAPQEAGPHYS